MRMNIFMYLFADIAIRRSSQFAGRVLSHTRSLSLRKSSRSAHVKPSQVSQREEEEEPEDLPDVGFGRILKMNKPEWLYMSSKDHF